MHCIEREEEMIWCKKDVIASGLSNEKERLASYMHSILLCGSAIKSIFLRLNAVARGDKGHHDSDSIS